MCKWTGEEDNWESKENDPAKFPYHKDALNKDPAAAVSKTPSTPRSKKSKDAP